MLTNMIAVFLVLRLGIHCQAVGARGLYDTSDIDDDQDSADDSRNFEMIMGSSSPSKRHQPSSHHGSHCPTSVRELEAYGQWVSTQNGTHVVGVLMPTNVNFRKLDIADAEELDIPLAGGKGCQAVKPEAVTLSPLHVHETSLCPWYWQVNYDPKRLPTTIPEARCKCPRPLLSNGGGKCEEVYYKMRTLRYSDDCATFREYEEEVAVACVAVNQHTPFYRRENVVSSDSFIPIVAKRAKAMFPSGRTLL